MQGEITLEHRVAGDVWTFRWRQSDQNGKPIRHRALMGTLEQFPTIDLVKQTFAGMIRAINSGDIRVQSSTMTMSQLIAHYTQNELVCPNRSIDSGYQTTEDDKTYATIDSYEGYLRNYISPRWGQYGLFDVKTIEIEKWLKSLKLQRDPKFALTHGAQAKIRAVMKTVFNHAIRYDLYPYRNPVALVRVRGRRRRIPEILTIEDLRLLLPALDFREYVLVVIAVTTGLRVSELFALQWQDVDFANFRITVARSIVKQRIGCCKTDASHAAVPLPREVAEVLHEWQALAIYRSPCDWVFASSDTHGKKPYWAAPIMRKRIKPIAKKLGILRLKGWHTFRHSYASLLHDQETHLKIVQELMRHRTIRTTLDTYVQALTPSKRKAQEAVVQRLCLPKQINK